MGYNVKLVKTILDLPALRYDELNEFLLDVDKIFKNNFQFFVKTMYQFYDGKRQFLNRNFNDFMARYRGLLNMFLDEEVFKNFIALLSSDELYKQFLSFINYINKNLNNKSKMVECVNKLIELRITKFDFINNVDHTMFASETWDGQYHKLDSVYGDGDISFDFVNKKGFTENYMVNIQNSNCIIIYSKDNIDGLKSLDVYLKNLEFDIDKLPEYTKLYSKTCCQNIKGSKKLILK